MQRALFAGVQLRVFHQGKLRCWITRIICLMYTYVCMRFLVEIGRVMVLDGVISKSKQPRGASIVVGDWEIFWGDWEIFWVTKRGSRINP